MYVICYDFEALQVDVDSSFHGWNLHFEHVPQLSQRFETALHLISKINLQDLSDRFVKTLIDIQIIKEQLMMERNTDYTTQRETQINVILIEDSVDTPQHINPNNESEKQIEKSPQRKE